MNCSFSFNTCLDVFFFLFLFFKGGLLRLSFLLKRYFTPLEMEFCGMVLDNCYLTNYKTLFEKSEFGEIGFNSDGIDELTARLRQAQNKVDCCSKFKIVFSSFCN